MNARSHAVKFLRETSVVACIATQSEEKVMRIVGGTVIKRLSNRNAGPISEHARGNVHGCQLLEEQLSSVGNEHLRNPGLVLARPALEALPAEVSVDSVLVNGSRKRPSVGE